MPRFAANIGDGWLWKELPFLKRIEAAYKAGFTAIECPFPYKYVPYEVKKELDKYNIKFALLNQTTLPDYKNDNGRFAHGIYPDEINLFEKSLRNAIDYANIVNCPNNITNCNGRDDMNREQCSVDHKQMDIKIDKCR